MRVAPRLSPISWNAPVPDNPALHGPLRLRSYQVNLNNLDKIQPAENDRDRVSISTSSIDSENSDKHNRLSLDHTLNIY